MIDTVALYVNESAVGRAIKKSGVPREELFVTSNETLSTIEIKGDRYAAGSDFAKRVGL